MAKTSNKMSDLSVQNSNEKHDCFICCNEITVFAVGDCNHPTCHLCMLRMRVLYKSKACSFCKKELPKVMLTREGLRKFESFTDKDFAISDEKTSISFQSQKLKREMLNILRFNCADRDCAFVAGNWSSLAAHVREVHGRVLCEICTRNKKAFAHEHRLYSHAKLREHYAGRDEASGTGFKGHPQCEFCHERFYDDDLLFEHCHKKHQECQVCRREFGKYVYFRDYPELEKHFRSDHFLCDRPECLEQKFIVFATDIDLIAHQSEVHGIAKGQRSQKQKKLQVEVNFTYTDTRPKRGESSRQVSEQGLASSSRLVIPERASGANSPDQRRAPHGVRERFRNIPSDFGEFSAEQVPPDENSRPPPDPNILLFIDGVTERIRTYIGTNEQRLQSIKDLLLHFKESEIDEEAFVNGLCEINWPTSSPYKNKGLNGEKKKTIGAVINAVILELRNEQAGNRVMRAWKDKLALTTQFPVLKASDKYTSSTLKPGIWSSQYAEPPAIRGRGVVPNTTAWSPSAASQSRSIEEFPSLSTNSRKSKGAAKANSGNIWHGQSQHVPAENHEGESSRRKTKGKGKQVILRLG